MEHSAGYGHSHCCVFCVASCIRLSHDDVLSTHKLAIAKYCTTKFTMLWCGMLLQKAHSVCCMQEWTKLENPSAEGVVKRHRSGSQPESPPDNHTIQMKMAIVSWQPGPNRVLQVPNQARFLKFSHILQCDILPPYVRYGLLHAYPIGSNRCSQRCSMPAKLCHSSQLPHAGRIGQRKAWVCKLT